MDTTYFTIIRHDLVPSAEGATVDQGLGDSNDVAAPLHEVRPLSCFAYDREGRVIGGAIGRRWHRCCELQQLWVAREHRARGIGSSLVRAFEAHAREHGCAHFYLETFSFQAPQFYKTLGYQVAFELAVYPHGIVRFLMLKHDVAPDTATLPHVPTGLPPAST